MGKWRFVDSKGDRMSRFRPKHSTVVAYVALLVALGGSATAVTRAANSSPASPAANYVPNASGFYNSGLIKLNNGQSKKVVSRGPFRLTAKCVDEGSGSSLAELLLKNTGTKNVVLESDFNSEYSAPTLAPGETRTAFYSEAITGKYFFGDYYNLFSAAATGNPPTAITGLGSLGWHALGADCLFQLVLIG
jgi:hypothetical protein